MSFCPLVGWDPDIGQSPHGLIPLSWAGFHPEATRLQRSARERHRLAAFFERPSSGAGSCRCDGLELVLDFLFPGTFPVQEASCSFGRRRFLFEVAYARSPLREKEYLVAIRFITIGLEIQWSSAPIPQTPELYYGKVSEASVRHPGGFRKPPGHVPRLSGDILGGDLAWEC